MRLIDAHALAAHFMCLPPDYYHTSYIVGEIMAAPTVHELDNVKEQESVSVGKRIKTGDVVLDFYECGHCKNSIRKPWRYCPFCGREVKWDD